MESNIKQAVILAGGLGTRLKPFTDDNPKPMYPVNRIPFIERLVMQIKSFGIDDIVILLGYLPNKVIDYLGNGDKYGLSIKYDITPVEYDTLERMNHAKDLLNESFLLMYCDNYCPIDYNKLVDDFNKNNPLIQLSVYDNSDNYTKDNVYVKDGKVLVYDKTHKESRLQGVEIGYAIVDKRILSYCDSSIKNLSQVFPILIEKGKLFATTTLHRYYSIGSFDRMKLTEEFFKDRKVVFLDRDGTLNVRPPKACYVEKEEDFIWIPGSMEAIKLLKNAGYITILISNQPGIARGNLTVETLDRIHEKMQSDLKKLDCSIDYIYYCPHNWDDGCDCRKPKPGLLYQAQKDLSLDLTKCILFGDDERDIKASDNANCPSVLVSEEYPLIEAVKDYLEGEKI